MDRSSPRDLPFRFGCSLALLLTAVCMATLAFAAHRSLAEAEAEGVVLMALYIVPPFAALALARVRDVLAWAVGSILTAMFWAYLLAGGRFAADLDGGFILVLIEPLSSRPYASWLPDCAGE